MTNEQLDALFRKVFDDAEAGDAQLLASATGDVLGREETILGNLKSELRGLADVPECQMSTDRLRDAILSRGAMPDRVSPFRNWWKFAAPVAACAALAAFLMTNPNAATIEPQGTSGPIASNQEIPDQTALEPAVTPGVQSLDNEPAPPSADTMAATGPVEEDSAALEAPKPTPKRTTRAPRYAANTRSQAPSPGLGGGVDSAALLEGTSTAVASLAAGAIEGFRNRGSESISQKSEPADSTVVIVGAGADPQTRANPATEVDKKNVVFGG